MTVNLTYRKSMLRLVSVGLLALGVLAVAAPAAQEGTVKASHSATGTPPQFQLTPEVPAPVDASRSKEVAVVESVAGGAIGERGAGRASGGCQPAAFEGAPWEGRGWSLQYAAPQRVAQGTDCQAICATRFALCIENCRQLTETPPQECVAFCAPERDACLASCRP
jgi:hypothetical protein